MRKFGTWELATQQTYRRLPSLVQLGIEPMNVKDTAAIHKAFSDSSRPIKSLLLDQTILLGIGNIYADEILFATQLHPLTPGTKLTLAQTKKIIEHGKTILLQAIAAGGSRIRSYQPGHGIDGHFQQNIHVYGREGLPCHTCNHRIHRLTIAGRSASYCPRCQHRHDFPLVIAITGEIATGKSTTMQFARQRGFLTLSADDCVKKIYQQKKYFPRLKTIFGLSIIREGRVQTLQILDDIIADQTKRIALEKFIHPLVETMLIKAILAARVNVVFIEVPLLFQANLDYLADQIILMEQPFVLQTKLVNSRNPHIAEKLLALNHHNRSRAYREYADVIITNGKSLQALEKTFAKTLKAFGL
jgi:dephospho-CoA kinase